MDTNGGSSPPVLCSCSNSEHGGPQNAPSGMVETPLKQSPRQGDNMVTNEDRRLDMILADHPIIQNMLKQEIGKVMLAVSISITVAFTIYFFYQKSPPVIIRLVVVLMSIGCTTILNGLLLRDYFPLTAILMEVVGITIVILAVHAIVGSFIPLELRWIGGVISCLSVAPFIASVISVMYRATRS